MATATSAVAAIIFYLQRPPVSPESEPSIALFPLENLSNDDNVEFGVQVAEDIISRLNSVQGLQTKSLSYVTALLDQGMDPVEVSERVDASHILQGNLLVVDGELTVNVELIEARNGDLVWSQPYQRNLSELLTVQQEISNSIARVFGIDSQSSASVVQRTVVPSAYHLYAKANGLLNEFDVPGALQALTEATRIDPSFAEAYSKLANIYLISAWGFEDRFGPFADSARINARQALEIDPTLKEAQLILIALDAIQYRWSEAEEAYRRFVAAAPNEEFQWAAPIVINFGRVGEAIEISRRLHDQNPFGEGLYFQTVYYSVAGEASRALQASEILQSEGRPFDSIRIGVIHAKNGDIDKASELFATFFRAAGIDPSLSTAFATSIANGIMDEGLEAALESAAVDNTVIEAQKLFAYVYVGVPADEVFELANRLLDKQRLNVIAFYEPYAAVYREDPRFVDLIEQIGLGDHWRNYGAPDFCASESIDKICE